MNLNHLPIAFDTKSIRDDGSFEGYASIFGNLDAARDIVAPGAFATTLKSGRRVKMLWQHDPAAPIGRWTSLVEDAKGLHARGRILREVVRGNEIYALMKAEAVDGLSIGFRTIDEEIDRLSGARVLKAVDLFEISVVTFPANDLATVAALKGGRGVPDADTAAVTEVLRRAAARLGG